MTAAAYELEQTKHQGPQYYGFPTKDYNGYILGLEYLADSLEEAKKLHKEHWNETEVLYLDRPMDIDYNLVTSMEANRQFLFFSIRKDEEMIGNFGFYVALSTHFAGQLMAREDFLFITKAHRGGHLAGEFYRYAEECLVKLGVKLIGISDKAPCGGKSLGPLLTREGFKEVSTIYIKEVN